MAVERCLRRLRCDWQQVYQHDGLCETLLSKSASRVLLCGGNWIAWANQGRGATTLSSRSFTIKTIWLYPARDSCLLCSGAHELVRLEKTLRQLEGRMSSFGNATAAGKARAGVGGSKHHLAQLLSAQKNSSNSSKPPPATSSNPKASKKKKRNAVLGARRASKHQRRLYSDQVNQRVPFRLSNAGQSSHRIAPAEGLEHQRTIQQVELVDKPFVILETLHSIWCMMRLLSSVALPRTSSRLACSGAIDESGRLPKGRVTLHTGIRDSRGCGWREGLAGLRRKLLRKAGKLARLWRASRIVAAQTRITR